MKPFISQLEDLERRLSRPRKPKSKMKVSGASVRTLQRIIIKKGKRARKR